MTVSTNLQQKTQVAVNVALLVNFTEIESLINELCKSFRIKSELALAVVSIEPVYKVQIKPKTQLYR